METFAQYLEETAEEPILRAVIGEMGWGGCDSENIPNYKDIPFWHGFGLERG